MDLYDDLDTKQRAGHIDGWSSGIKMLQAQLAIKKATLPQPKKEPPKKPVCTNRNYFFLILCFGSTLHI